MSSTKFIALRSCLNPRFALSLNRVETALLEWYGQNARALPWRETRDAYAILVSEVMAQQTQVTPCCAYS